MPSINFSVIWFSSFSYFLLLIWKFVAPVFPKHLQDYDIRIDKFSFSLKLVYKNKFLGKCIKVWHSVIDSWVWPFFLTFHNIDERIKPGLFCWEPLFKVSLSKSNRMNLLKHPSPPFFSGHITSDVNRPFDPHNLLTQWRVRPVRSCPTATRWRLLQPHRRHPPMFHHPPKTIWTWPAIFRPSCPRWRIKMPPPLPNG